MSTDQPQPANDDADRSTLTRDAGIGAGVAVLFLLLRLFAVSEWNWSTAAAVVDTLDFDDAISIVFGTLFARPDLSGAMLVVLFPLTAIAMVWPAPGGKRFSLSALFAVAAYTAVTVALVSTHGEWWLPLGILLVGALTVAPRLLWRHGVAQEITTWLAKSVGVLALCAGLLLAILVDSPWVVRERIVTDKETLTGYVLRTEPGFLKVLTDGEREFMIVPSGEVKSREVAE